MFLLSYVSPVKCLFLPSEQVVCNQKLFMFWSASEQALASFFISSVTWDVFPVFKKLWNPVFRDFLHIGPLGQSDRSRAGL